MACGTFTAVGRLDLFGNAVSVQVEIEPCFIDPVLPGGGSGTGILAVGVFIIDAASNQRFRHFVFLVHRRQLVDHVLAVSVTAQVGSRLDLPVGNKAGMLHVGGIGGYDHALARNGLHGDLPRIHILPDREIINRAERRVPFHDLHSSGIVDVDGLVLQQCQRFLFGKAGILQNAALGLHRAMCQRPSNTLAQPVRKYIMHYAEHVPLKNDLVDVCRGVAGVLFLLRRPRVEPDDLVTAENTHQPWLRPFHSFQHRAVDVCGKLTLLPFIVVLVPVSEVTLLELGTFFGELTALAAHAAFRLPLDDALEARFYIYVWHQSSSFVTGSYFSILRVNTASITSTRAPPEYPIMPLAMCPHPGESTSPTSWNTSHAPKPALMALATKFLHPGQRDDLNACRRQPNNAVPMNGAAAAICSPNSFMLSIFCPFPN